MEDDLRSAASAAPPSYRAEEIRASLLADAERLGPDRARALVTAAALVVAVALLAGLGGILAGAIVEPPPASSPSPLLGPPLEPSPPRESVDPSSAPTPTPDSVVESRQPESTGGDRSGQPSPSPAPAGSVPPAVTPGPESPSPPSPPGPPDSMPSIPPTWLPSFVP